METKVRKGGLDCIVFGVLILALVSLSSCGGSSISINQIDTTKGKIPPGPLIDRLQKAMELGADAEANDFLLGMLGPSGERLDWNRFWAELAGRGFRKQLVTRHGNLLFSLHSRDCDAFGEFTGFVLSVESGYEYILGEKRRCQTRLAPSLAFALARQIEKQATGAPRLSTLEEIMRFLTAEQEGNRFSAGWAQAINDNDDWIVKVGEEFLKERRIDSLLNLLLTNEQDASGLSRISRISGPVLASGEMRSAWFKRFGVEEGLDRFYASARQSFTGLSESETNSLLQDLHTFVVGGEVQFSPVFLGRISRAMALTRQLGKGRSLKTQLDTYDTWIVAVEERSNQVKNDEEKDALFERAWAKSAGTYWQEDLLWLARRAAPDKSNLLRVNAVIPTKGETEMDHSLRLLERIYNDARDSYIPVPVADRENSISTYCEYLRGFQVPTVKVAVAHLESSLKEGIGSICVVVLPGHTDDKLTIRSDSPLRASFASVILGDASIHISAPRLRLGTVLLRTTLRQSSQRSTPTPPTANARVFPLLLGVTLPKDTIRFKRGSYFFFYHYSDRKPSPGEKEPGEPAQGFSGPDLTLTTTIPSPRFPFLSLGGPGQARAFARPGGKGDRSSVDMDRVTEWLDGLSQTSRLDVVRPIRILSELNYDGLEDLLQNGEHSDNENVKILIIPEFTRQIPSEARSKLMAACEEHLGRALEKKDVEICLKDTFAPQALQEMFEVLDRSKIDGLISRTDSIPEFDARTVFIVDDAQAGPENADGPRGASGRLTVNGPSVGGGE